MKGGGNHSELVSVRASERACVRVCARMCVGGTFRRACMYVPTRSSRRRTSWCSHSQLAPPPTHPTNSNILLTARSNYYRPIGGRQTDRPSVRSDPLSVRQTPTDRRGTRPSVRSSARLLAGTYDRRTTFDTLAQRGVVLPGRHRILIDPTAGQPPPIPVGERR